MKEEALLSSRCTLSSVSAAGAWGLAPSCRDRALALLPGLVGPNGLKVKVQDKKPPSEGGPRLDV